ncbi:MAG: helix-turn-helix transcriptional regulator [Thermodesulfovibrionia bacterium]|nr:helix-turn-helix transcriptional regulator [Thermodesulfovibrionia bacterium]
MINNPLGQRIKIARKKAGLTQDKLAKAIGVAYPTLNKYERGHRIPSAELLSKMSETLQCDPGWLLVGDNSASQKDDPELALISRILKNDLPEAKHTILRLLKDWKASKG